MSPANTYLPGRGSRRGHLVAFEVRGARMTWRWPQFHSAITQWKPPAELWVVIDTATIHHEEQIISADARYRPHVRTLLTVKQAKACAEAAGRARKGARE